MCEELEDEADYGNDEAYSSDNVPAEQQSEPAKQEATCEANAPAEQHSEPAKKAAACKELDATGKHRAEPPY